MGVFDSYPYSNLHSLNLKWIVNDMLKLNNAYDGLKKEIQETIDYINNFESHADELINERIDIALSYYTQKLNQLNNQLQDLENLVNNELFNEIESIKSDLTQIKADITNFEFNVNQKLTELEELMHEYKHSIDKILDGKTQELEQYIIEKVTKLDRLDVINPLTGIYENIQKVLDEMAAVITKSYGITAEQYDSLDITAFKYDSYLMTAEEYSTRGYFSLYLTLTLSLMRSPFTGQITSIEDVVTKLSELHKCALSAAEYDSLNITAEEYDYMDITAFAYDWFGFKIVRLITAIAYDGLELTAYNYDAKKITAEMYSKGMKALLDTELKPCINSCGNYFLLANQITAMQAEIDKLKKEPITMQSGTTYCGVCNIGETINSLTIPEIQSDDIVTINTDRSVKPLKVEIKPSIGVIITWSGFDTLNEPLSYTVNVSNKIN